MPSMAGNPDFSDSVVSLFGPAELTIPGQPGFPFGGSQPMAVYADIEVESTGSDWYLAEQPYMLNFGLLGGNRMYAALGQSNKNIQGSAPIVAGEKYTVVLNFDGKTLSIYVDGVLDAQGADWNSGNNNDPMTFGVNPTTRYPEQGVSINRLGMWKRALTPAEIGVTS